MLYLANAFSQRGKTMNKARAITLTSVILAAAMADASTWTWNGGDGEWFSDNWLKDGVEVTGNPGAAPADDIEIDGAVSVTYTPADMIKKDAIMLAGLTKDKVVFDLTSTPTLTYKK